MEQNLQEFNANQKLLEWSERIASCRNSGMSVKDWCKANGIPLSTYYNQQRKVLRHQDQQLNTSRNHNSPRFVYRKDRLHPPPQSGSAMQKRISIQEQTKKRSAQSAWC